MTPGLWMGTLASGKIAASGPRGVFGGGRVNSSTLSAVMDYISIASLGNATTFGNLATTRYSLGACASATRGIFAGGTFTTGGGQSNTMEYITIETTSNAASYSTLSSGGSGHAHASPTTGIFLPNNTGDGTKFTIATLNSQTLAQNADFGQNYYSTFSCADGTRAIISGAIHDNEESPQDGKNTIYYRSIEVAVNVSTFGAMTTNRAWAGSCASATRGIFAGGVRYSVDNNVTNTIDYITIQTTGNATSFGNLTQAKASLASCASQTRGVFAHSGYTNQIEYITIATTGNAADFGDLSTYRTALAGLAPNFN